MAHCWHLLVGLPMPLHSGGGRTPCWLAPDSVRYLLKRSRVTENVVRWESFALKAATLVRITCNHMFLAGRRAGYAVCSYHALGSYLHCDEVVSIRIALVSYVTKQLSVAAQQRKACCQQRQVDVISCSRFIRRCIKLQCQAESTHSVVVHCNFSHLCISV
jgi:hypothetical protein